jgi:hypothetical protein
MESQMRLRSVVKDSKQGEDECAVLVMHMNMYDSHNH